MPVILPTEAITLESIVRDGWRDHRRRVMVLRGVLAAVLTGLLASGSASPALAGDTCANAAVRAQTGSISLPDCRGYEMVSSPYKEGFSVDPAIFLGFTDDGLVSYRSIGNFAGNLQGAPFNPYHATRTAAGWATTAISPPDVLYDTGGNGAGETADLRTSLWTMSRRAVPGDTTAFYLRDPGGAFTRIGEARDALGPRFVVGWSADFSHLVFNHGSTGADITALYEHVGTDNDFVPRAVSVDNQGQPRGVTCPNDVSVDGRVIVYTTACGGDGAEIWARVAGSATVAVSGSECTRTSGDLAGPCNGPSAAEYVGGAVDGSRLFVTTSQQLVNGDTDTGKDLYACTIPPGAPAPVGSANPCASLTEISGTTSNAQVENVTAVSKDGSQVYFVAQGALADNLGVGGVGPVTGSHNLYLWQRDDAHPVGKTRFVARLDEDDVGRAQMTPDNRYLLFLTRSRLVTVGPGADTDDAVDAYRYDTVTKTIVRVSTSPSGSGGNATGFDVSMVVRASSMTADGSTVIFDSGEALSAGDTDGVTDVYAWRDGQVSLISAGGGNSAGISPSGRDIFFTTDAPVLAADGDFNKDIYDARVGGGFTPSQTTPCAGDGCRGQRSQPPTLPGPAAPGTASGNLTETSPAYSLRAVSAGQRKRLAATGKVGFTVTTNAPGIVSVKATVTMGGRSVTAGSGRRTMTAPGKVTVSLSLSKSARRQLAARGRMSVRVAVSHSKVALDRSVTLRLVHAKAKAKRSVQREPVAGVGGGRS